MGQALKYATMNIWLKTLSSKQNIKIGIGMATSSVREVKLIAAEEFNKEFADRLELGMLDRFTLSSQLKGLTPISGVTDGSTFEGNSFEDLVNTQNGEHLGGAALKRVSKKMNNLGAINSPGQRVMRIFGDEFYDRELTLIGILDKDNKPCGIIAFLEGNGLRVPKKVETKPEAGKPALLLQPTTST